MCGACVWTSKRSPWPWLGAQYERLRRHMKGNKALVALAHAMIIIVHHRLKGGSDYRDRGPDYYTERDRKAIELAAVRNLNSLGYTLHPQSQVPLHRPAR